MKRYIAHVTIEAKTPLKIGSNALSFFNDAPVQRDWNSLPMIPATTIAGILRKEFDQQYANTLFGCEDGSKVSFSNALLCDEAGKVTETLLLEISDFLQHYQQLPQREHTAIDDKGVALEHSKFDEEVVFRGSRFRFSIEVLDDEEGFRKLLDTLCLESLRIGGGSTKGFGAFTVIDISYDSFTPEEYKEYNNSLNTELAHPYKMKHTPSRFLHYRVELTPEDFYIFGSGFGDEESDNTPVEEQVVSWDNGSGRLTSAHTLIPASSIKGALSHRVAFHYNKSEEIYADEVNNCSEFLGENNDAVNALFGEKKDSRKKRGHKGKILLSDSFIQKQPHKIFDHVAIDRFTGGAIDGALFQEKVTAGTEVLHLDIFMEQTIQPKYKEAFEKALDDLCNGMLPLGGMNTKGHGFWNGQWNLVQNTTMK